MNDFVQKLTATNPASLKNISRPSPPRYALRTQYDLIDEAVLAERYARDILIYVWAVHHQHSEDRTFIQALATAQRDGIINTSRIQRFILTSRNTLKLHIVPLAEQLARHHIAFDYSELHRNLVFFNPQTQNKWQQQLHAAL